MANENSAWQLDDFVDSLVVELDKTRETLAVKAINRPLSYTVKEVALDLNIFPSYDGDNVTFITAQPGQQGASKVTIQLGSITDQQVRATSKAPTARGDINLDQINIDKSTKKKLRKLGVNSVDDLKQIEQKKCRPAESFRQHHRLLGARQPNPQDQARSEPAPGLGGKPIGRRRWASPSLDPRRKFGSRSEIQARSGGQQDDCRGDVVQRQGGYSP